MSTPLKQSKKNLSQAVHRSSIKTSSGLLERAFTFAFKGMVYPQIWEDPQVDMKALQLKPDSRIITIASGGCNVLSYLTANPEQIIAVDLNRAHVALNHLKLAAIKHLPDYSTFYRFFGEAHEKANVEAYHLYLKDKLDKETRHYWESRDWTGRRRITLFSRDLYHHGLLGYFIGLTHKIAKFYGVNLNEVVKAKTLDEQRTIFDRTIAPLFDKRLIRWATSKKMSLYGLGIPPAQYEELAASGGGDMAVVLKGRLEKLACGFSMSDNYFAWQAFSRGYAPASPKEARGSSGPLPPYLSQSHYEEIKSRVGRVQIRHKNFKEQLVEEADQSMHGFVLLDAQDWMTDEQLNDLWAEMSRTAHKGGRVIFRTAGVHSILPGRLSPDILACWNYEEEESQKLNAEDRSAIYGGFHIYTRQ
ncbi:DUF3419 family protein [Polycladidibacter stylochi]|uniref:DUF3419 family protein n=1 Tax=Polycladidibacter stylochi TaxID=1807766 RepID=UPI00082E5371|nr:DUF3419 family protein [Pseudovibrio stylochi]